MEALGVSQRGTPIARPSLAPFRVNASAPCASARPRQAPVSSRLHRQSNCSLSCRSAVILSKARQHRPVSCSAATSADAGGQSSQSRIPQYYFDCFCVSNIFVGFYCPLLGYCEPRRCGQGSKLLASVHIVADEAYTIQIY